MRLAEVLNIRRFGQRRWRCRFYARRSTIRGSGRQAPGCAKRSSRIAGKRADKLPRNIAILRSAAIVTPTSPGTGCGGPLR